MNIALTKMSSKGQVVIPAQMRKGMKEGEQLIVLQQDHFLIIKPASKTDKNFEEDIIFSQRTEEAWKRHDRGEFKRMKGEDFLKEMEKW